MNYEMVWMVAVLWVVAKFELESTVSDHHIVITIWWQKIDFFKIFPKVTILWWQVGNLKEFLPKQCKNEKFSRLRLTFLLKTPNIVCFCLFFAGSRRILLRTNFQAHTKAKFTCIWGIFGVTIWRQEIDFLKKKQVSYYMVELLYGGRTL